MKYIDADKLKAEIERRITDNTFGAKLELIDILAWLDTLESEKPVPNDLDQAAVNWICNHKNGEVLYVKDAFIAGAKWQEENDQETIKLAEDHAFLAGADRQKEQMMSNAVEGTVYGNGVYTWVAGDIPSQFKYGDKVRVIVLPKED